MKSWRTAVAVGAALALAGTVHTAFNLRHLRRPEEPTRRLDGPEPEASTPERISVLLPARNEAARISPTLTSLLAQQGDDLEFLILDDDSTDGTAELVRSLVGHDPRFTVLHGGGPPPPRWLGKPWACQRLSEAASGTVLVFVDADVVLEPDAVRRAVGLLRSAGLDLVSPYPRQVAETPLERLVQPLLQWSWLTTLPLRRAESSSRESLAAANGQFLVVDASAYRRAGAHGAVRGDILEDVALVRAIKRSGGRGGVADGTDIATCRMYTGADELIAGYTKSLWSAFGSPAGAAAACTMLSMAYVVPPVAALAGPDARTRAVGAAGYCAAVAGRLMVAQRTGQRTWPDVLSHPASIVAFCALTGTSVRRKSKGTLVWAGRAV